MLPDEIQDHEILYRGIHPKHAEEVDGVKRITSAAFKDSFGNSVDRDGRRDEINIVKSILERFPKKGLAKISAKTCRAKNTKPIPKPEDNNPYHALIIRHNDEIQLKSKEARDLRKACERLFFPGEGETYLNENASR